MTNLQAGLGLAQLEKIDRHIEIKRQIGAMYNEWICDVKELERPPSDQEYARNIYWVYGLILADSVPYDAEEAGGKRHYYVVAFQSVKPKGKNQEERLVVSFREYRGDDKKIRRFSVPADLKIRPYFFFEGFQAITGAKDLDLEQKFDWQKEKKPVKGPVVGDDGTKDVPI